MSLKKEYEERKQEVCAYLDFLQSVEAIAPSASINTDQRNILIASVYLLFYNLVEATITKCSEELKRAFADYSVADIYGFTDQIRDHWINCISHVHKTKPERRREGVKALFDKLSNQNSTLDMVVDFKGEGNLDNKKIAEIMSKYGIDVTMPPSLNEKVCHRKYNNGGIMQAIKMLRNDLAHGGKSFKECGTIFSIIELKELSLVVFEYLEFIITKIEDYLSRKLYMSHPHNGGA